MLWQKDNARADWILSRDRETELFLAIGWAIQWHARLRTCLTGDRETVVWRAPVPALHPQPVGVDRHVGDRVESAGNAPNGQAATTDPSAALDSVSRALSSG